MALRGASRVQKFKEPCGLLLLLVAFVFSTDHAGEKWTKLNGRRQFEVANFYFPVRDYVMQISGPLINCDIDNLLGLNNRKKLFRKHFISN